MLKATIYLQRKTGEGDDILKIYEDELYVEMYRLVYEAPDIRKKNQFYLSRHLVGNYISDFLTSLRDDSDPFEYIQLSTVIHPTVLYHISDLERPATRHLIDDMITMAMRTPVEKV